jgi:uncharacterized protein (TIGR02246 family)
MRPFDPNECIALYTRLLEAWNRRSADDFAALFDAEGSAVGFDGSEMNGRDEIAASLKAVFDNHPTAAYVARIREVRELGAGGALVRAVAGMVAPGTLDLDPAVNAIQNMLLIERDSTLWIALFQNTPAAFHGRPAASEALTRELTEVLLAGRVVQVA